jgi:hypothetical protein
MSELGLFGDLDIASANDNPFYKPNDTYLCTVTGAGVKTSNKNGSKGWTLDYSIHEGQYQGRRIQEWKNIPHLWNVKGYKSKEDMDAKLTPDPKIAEAAERDISFLKKRLKDFGIPEEEMNSVTPDRILNLGFLNVTMKNDDGREKVIKVELAGAASRNESDPFA